MHVRAWCIQSLAACANDVLYVGGCSRFAQRYMLGIESFDGADDGEWVDLSGNGAMRADIYTVFSVV